MKGQTIARSPVLQGAYDACTDPSLIGRWQHIKQNTRSEYSTAFLAAGLAVRNQLAVESEALADVLNPEVTRISESTIDLQYTCINITTGCFSEMWTEENYQLMSCTIDSNINCWPIVIRTRHIISINWVSEWDKSHSSTRKKKKNATRKQKLQVGCRSGWMSPWSGWSWFHLQASTNHIGQKLIQKKLRIHSQGG